ncbi:CobW domain-containingprotein [Purpureocillium lavendulum]|uniref:CobW domain-containingprotein n=1 Tax=Purpureocillium lavendulum TaxID=1247861 RepID=A0AB34FMN1_9HYPO|nr:CobW domain-containingprotein [Purpureocillium lavendulum]
MQVPKKPLPVTLLSGFLGSGKTTLLQHILKTEHGLRIAVVVNDIGAINIDAALIKKTHQLTKKDEKVIALQNGCICCTLRGDLLEELVRLAQLQEFDYIIIESSGISEPEQVAETFDARLADTMGDMAEAPGASQLDESMIKVLKQLKKAGGLEKFAKLDTTVTVIDAFTMMHDFDTADLLSSRRDDVTPEDERTVSDLMVDQIEFAEVIVLNKTDMVSEETRKETRSLVTKLNHRAKIIEATYGKVDVKQLVNTGLFKLDVAQAGYGWLQDLHEMTVREVNGRNVLTPKPETEEYNVQSFIYSRYRPFHPRRLFALLHDKFILQMEHPDDEDDDGDDDDEEDGDGGTDVDMEDQQDEDMEDSGSSGSSASAVALGSSPLSARSASTARTAPSPTAKAVTAQGHEDMDDSGTTRMQLDDDDNDSNSNNTDSAENPLDIPANDTILANKRAHPTLRRLFRSKGEFHLATRPHRAGDWSQAGAMLTLTGGRPWFCTLPAAAYATGDSQVDALVRHDVRKGGEWGDRRQELVFIGEGLDRAALAAMLDACLLTDGEMAAWEGVMRDPALDGATGAGAGGERKRRERLEELFDDGFPDWAEDDVDEEEEEEDGGGDEDDDDEGQGPDHQHQHSELVEAMPGNYGPDPALCKHYAGFASHMSLWQFQVVYWVLFVLNLVVLFFSSWIYTKNTIQASQGDESGDDEEEQAELIGFTVSGGPIVRFMSPVRGPAASQGNVIGHGSEKNPIIAFEKGIIAFVAATDSDETNDRRP